MVLGVKRTKRPIGDFMFLGKMPRFDTGCHSMSVKNGITKIAKDFASLKDVIYRFISSTDDFHRPMHFLSCCS